METQFDKQINRLHQKATQLVGDYLTAIRQHYRAKLTIPPEFQADFFALVSKVTASLLADSDNFYGYFLLQMNKEIRFDISSPTAINFKKARYVLYFNPLIFLTLTLPQMESTMKHEILHIVSNHLLRSQELKGRYSTTAINMAMDIVVNMYLQHLPPYATTLAAVNANYNIKLLPFESFEYYAEHLQTAIDLLPQDKKGPEDDSPPPENIETSYQPEKTHSLWEESSNIDAATLAQFTEKFINQAQKGSVPDYVQNILAAYQHKHEIPWNLYLKKMLGTLESAKKKITTRKNRRQPERLDLRGELRGHKTKLLIALDISGSISDEEFLQAMQEVLTIVKNYQHELTIVECDHEIRRIYKIKTNKDIKERLKVRGATKFSPVFAYANKHEVNLVIYFTDGQGEPELTVTPTGYKILWVISGDGAGLSLETPYGAVKQLSKQKKMDITLDLNDVIRDGFSMQNQEFIRI